MGVGLAPHRALHRGRAGRVPHPCGMLRGRFRQLGTVAATVQAIRWRYVGVGLAPHRAFRGGRAGRVSHPCGMLRGRFRQLGTVAAAAQAIPRRRVGVGLAPHRTSTVVVGGSPASTRDVARAVPAGRHRRRSRAGNPTAARRCGACPTPGLPRWSRGASPASPGVLRERTEPQPRPQPLQRYGPGPRQTSSPRRYTYITVTTWRASPMDCSSGASGGSRRHLLEPRLSATSAGQTIR